tara:strand:- start:9005 stop:9628 length:624 start_codon:yes stop_codon:yes gene_type:complete
MKKILLALSVLPILFLTSCGSDVPSEIDNSENQLKLEQIKQDSILSVAEKTKLEQLKQDSINLLLGEVKVSLYKHSGLDYDSEGFCISGSVMDQPKIRAVRNYHEKKEFKAGKGIYVQKLQIEGNVGNLHIVFTDKKDKVLHEIEDYNLEGSLSFSTENLRGADGMEKELKQRDFANWFGEASKVLIQYKDSNIFEGTWRSNGRFRQ